MHTLFQFITRAHLTLVDDTTKWRSCQIFITRIAPVHHLLSEYMHVFQTKKLD